MTYVTYEFGFNKPEIRAKMREREAIRQRIWRLNKKAELLSGTLAAIDRELAQHRRGAQTA
jgi:hypothetical protein